MKPSRVVSIRLCTVWLAYRRSPDGGCQGFFRSSGSHMVVAAKPPPPPNYHLARINQPPKRAIRSPGVFGDRGFFFSAPEAVGDRGVSTKPSAGMGVPGPNVIS